MLKKALKLDQVHTFGDISESQLVEKFDFVTERVLFNQRCKTLANSQTLITVISLAFNGLLAESDKDHKKVYDRYVHQKIPDSLDSTKIYNNMSEISWKRGRYNAKELVSMVDLTSRITSLTTAILLLFQFVFRMICEDNDKMNEKI